VEIELCVDRRKANLRFPAYPAHSTLATSQRSHVGFLSSHLTRRVRHVRQPVRDLRFLSFMARVRGQQNTLLSLYMVYASRRSPETLRVEHLELEPCRSEMMPVIAGITQHRIGPMVHQLWIHKTSSYFAKTPPSVKIRARPSKSPVPGVRKNQP
jgi:hypothetical protein